MDDQATLLHPNHQTVFEKSVSACQADGRVMAALLVGCKGKADAHPDKLMFKRLERWRNGHR